MLYYIALYFFTLTVKKKVFTSDTSSGFVNNFMDSCKSVSLWSNLTTKSSVRVNSGTVMKFF